METFQLYDEFAHRQQEVMRLREESQHHQVEMHRLESEFREQEFEYRRRLTEATSQLDQSKLQAEAASQAVARMREQFDALNGQIEELSKDQHKIEAKESEQSEEFQRIREEIEAAKAEAERSRDDSDRQRAAAEARVAELEAEIDRLQANQGVDDQQYQAQLEANQVAADQMSQQIAELQKSVADASEESSQLRTDYEQACEKVLQLEALVSESQQRGDEDRDEWAVEAEQLRAEVDRLSADLTEANNQLTEVRDANENLNTRLSDVQLERDDARVERDARPTTEAFQTLREELDAANDQLTEMKLQYDEILTRLQNVESPPAELEPSGLGLVSTVDPVDQEAASGSEPAYESDGACESDAAYESDAACETEPEGATESSYPDEPIADSKYAPTEQYVSEQTDDDDAAQDGVVAEQVAEEEVVGENLVAVDPDADTSDVEESVVWEAAEHDSAEHHPVENQLAEQNLAEQNLAGEETDQQHFEQPEIAQEGAASVDDDAWPTCESLPAETDDQHEFEPTQVIEPDQGEADSAWNATPDSEAVADDHADSESLESTSHREESIANDSSLADQPDTPWQSEPVEEVQWSHEPAADDVAVTNDWSAPQEVDESTWGDQTEAGRFNDESVVSDDVEATTDNAWGSTELLGEADEPVMDESASADSVWGEAEPESTDIENSIVSGSLANSLIEDLENEASSEDYQSEPQDPNAEEAEMTHEGTFVMPEDSLGSQSSADNEPLDSESYQPENFNEPESDVTESHWDDVNEQSDEFPAAEPAFEQELEPSAELPVDATAPMPGGPRADDDSIEAYMNRLLQRVQGEDEPLPPEAEMPETISASTSQSSLTPLPVTKDADTEERAMASPQPIENDEPMVPRSQAPERAGDLSAMRDLANSSARSAISRSARVQSRDTQIQAMVSFACAVGALACNGVAFFFLSGVLLILAVAMTLVVAFCCLREGMHLLEEADRRVKSAEMSQDLDFDVDEKLVTNPSDS